MRIETAREGTTAILKLHGMLAGADAESLQASLKRLVDAGAPGIALDVTGIGFADSKGLEVLVEAAELMIRGGTTLQLRGKNPKLFEVLDLTELAPLFHIVGPAQPALEGAP